MNRPSFTVLLLALFGANVAATADVERNLFETINEEARKGFIAERYEGVRNSYSERHFPGVVTHGSEPRYDKKNSRYVKDGRIDLRGKRCTITIGFGTVHSLQMFDSSLTVGVEPSPRKMGENRISHKGNGLDPMVNPLQNGFKWTSRHDLAQTSDNVLHSAPNSWILFSRNFSKPLVYRLQDFIGNWAPAQTFPRDVTCETEDYRRALAQARPSEGQYAKLVSVWTGQGKYCLDEAKHRDLVYAHPCNGQDNQNFLYDPKSGSIRSRHSDRCLSIRDNSSPWRGQSMYPLELSSCQRGDEKQAFRVVSTARGLEFRDGWKNYCLNIHYGAGPKYRPAGYDVVAYPCASMDQQRWTFQN